MWTTAASAKSSATPEVVWKLWTAIEHWPAWDADLEWCSIDGPFAPGTIARIKPRQRAPIPFTITSCSPAKSFAAQARIAFTTIDLEFEVVALADGGVRITHAVRIAGMLAPALARSMGERYEQKLPDTVWTFARAAAQAAASTPDRRIEATLPAMRPTTLRPRPM